jgi:signal transduction histidine kinase
MVLNPPPVSSYFISQIQDITESKKLAQRLEDNEQRLLLATSSAHLGVWDLNVPTGELNWDDQMYRLYGVDKKNFKPSIETWKKSLLNEDMEEARQSVLDAIAGNRIFNQEFRVKWPNGTIRVIKGNGIVLRNNRDEPIRMIGVNSDITEDKKSFENLQRLNEFLAEAKRVAERATDLKSRFLDIAAHELRTPVTSFSLLLQFTEKKLAKGQPVDMDTLHRLKIQGDRISHLVIDLLDVSRLERGVLSMKPEMVNTNDLIQTCRDDFVLRTDGRQVTYNKPQEVIQGMMDPVRIYQVISNLLENAAKYTPEHNPIEISLSKKDKQICVSVTDHGPGIPKHQQEDLFTIFSRGSTELTERSGGLGLGLFICRSIVELHGGKISVTSIQGVGSTFTFVLPEKAEV